MQSREIREASEVRTQGSISSHLGEEEEEGGRQEEKEQRKGDVFFFIVIIFSGVIHDDVYLCTHLISMCPRDAPVYPCGFVCVCVFVCL